MVCETFKNLVHTELIKEQEGQKAILGIYGISLRKEETEV